MKNGLLTSFSILIILLIIPFESLLSNNLNPLIFGITFGIINRKSLKYNFSLGLLLTVVVCYLSFFIGLFGLFGFGELASLLPGILHVAYVDANYLVLFSGLIASLSLYLLFTKIYQNQNIKKGFTVMLLSYILIPLIVLTIPIIFSGARDNDFLAIYNLTWLLIVGFFLTYTFNNTRILEKANN